MTFEEMKGLSEKEQETLFNNIKKSRTSAKTVNFAATYGAGAAKISKTLKCEVSFAKNLHKTYWERNKAVKYTGRDAIVKTVLNQKWIYNTISGFWMFLKVEKDRFSTINQSSGVYFFDCWLMLVKSKLKGLDAHIVLQYHDECLIICKVGLKEKVEQALNEAIIEVNAEIKLNVTIGISIDWGQNYAECH